jgi:hypothetical protein
MLNLEFASSMMYALGRLGYDNTPHFKGFPLLIPGFCFLILGLFVIFFLLRRWNRFSSLLKKVSLVMCGCICVILGVLCWLNPFYFGRWIWPDPEGETMQRLGILETRIFQAIHSKKYGISIQEGHILSIFLEEKNRNPQSFFDPWEHPIILVVTQDPNKLQYMLASAGADGVFHTNDDLSVVLDEEREKQGWWRKGGRIPPSLGPIPSASASVCVLQPLGSEYNFRANFAK